LEKQTASLQRGKLLKHNHVKCKTAIQLVTNGIQAKINDNSRGCPCEICEIISPVQSACQRKTAQALPTIYFLQQK